MNKKLIPAVALGLVSLLTACGGSTAKAADVFIYKFSDTYITSVRTALEKDLKAKNITPTFQDGNGAQATQTEQIDNAISSGSKLIIPNLVDQTAAGETIAKKAKVANIPAIFFNREVPDAAVTSATYPNNCFVGTDPDQAGYMQGDILAKALIGTDNKLVSKWDKNGDGKINYVMLRADKGNAEADGRTKYSVQEANTKLTAAGLPVLVQKGEDQLAAWSKDTAKEKMDTLVTTYGLTGADGIEAVIANNDDMALGAIASLNTSGYNKANESDPTKVLLVVGVDATDAGKAAIDAGQMFGTVKQDAEAMAACIAALAENKLNGKDFLAGTTYKWDSDAVHKIRIPYGSYTK
jgi:methyl-galactoside transport system substrate-binding protein